MNTNANEDHCCLECGGPLPAGTNAGTCPSCSLLRRTETESGETKGRLHFEPPSILRIANLFPHLEVYGLLGAGGMGAVYQARQPALDRLVALKVLPVGRGSGFAERFNREARALARLSHQNIVSVHEFGQVEDLHYFLMELVDGTNLRQLEKGSRLSARQALEIIPQICDALQYAHDEGVVHRDIKPENVLVDRRGRVKIADFGLAMILDPSPEVTRLTVEGQIMGTPHYMAPEQLERPLAVDHRADIYALGVVFYEMLTGDLPIGKFLPPSRKVQVDVRLDQIVLRALENDPDRRYQKVSELRAELQIVTAAPAPLLDELPGVAGAEHRTESAVPDAQFPAPDPRGSSVISWWRRPVTGGLVVTSVVFLIAAWMMTQNEWPGRRSAESNDDSTVSFRHVAVRDPTTGSLYVALPNGARVELMAISRIQAEPTQWWRPDGSTVADSGFEIAGPADMAGPDTLKRQLALKISGAPPDGELTIYDFSPIANVSAGGTVVKDGLPVEGGWPLRVGWLSASPKATLRFGFRFGPWQTIAVLDLRDSARSFTRAETGGVEWITGFNHFSDDGTNTLLTVVLNREPRNWRIQVVAVDSEGTNHAYQRGSSTPIGTTETWTCTFPALTIDRIREFRVQVQAVHWAEFPGVALQPAGHFENVSGASPWRRAD